MDCSNGDQRANLVKIRTESSESGDSAKYRHRIQRAAASNLNFVVVVVVFVIDFYNLNSKIHL